MTPGQALRHEEDLDGAPDGTVIRHTDYVAEARTTTGRRWATTTGQLLTSAQVTAAGPVTVLDIPAERPDGADKYLTAIITAQAEVTALTAQRRRAADRLAARIARAHQAKVSYQAIADALGVSRQRVAMLARQAMR